MPSRGHSSPCIFMHHYKMRGLHSAAWRPSESILMALKGNLCRILQMDFGEFTFHALR